jgi:predicted oxidoreductase
MRKIEIEPGFSAPVIVAGCMRIAGFSDKEADGFIEACLANGVSYFDHADIYAGGQCETVFGNALRRKKSLRDGMILQTKCGIVPKKRFNFSKAHILSSVDNSLKRLQTEYVDTLLLHRPDTLMEPEEIAEAFDTLHAAGKVRHFGVSNFNPYQTELLKTALSFPLKINQVQFSAAFTGMVDSGFYVNTKHDAAAVRDSGLLEYSRLNGIALQAWSPFMHGFFGGVFIDSDQYPALNQKLAELAEKYGVKKSSVAVAFILRHPAKWQVVTGTTRPERIKEAADGAAIRLTGDEWYEIYLSAGNTLP